MRNARKRRLKRNHGSHPAKPRLWTTIKVKPVAPPVVRTAKPRSLGLMEL